MVSKLLAHVDTSSLYESEPMYVEHQPRFVNGVLIAESPLGPLALLDLLKGIELTLGREARTRNGPREVDLDLLAYGSLVLRSPRLVLPHPRWSERRFVVEPLFELAARRQLPACLPAREEIESLLLQPPLVQQSLVRMSGA